MQDNSNKPGCCNDDAIKQDGAYGQNDRPEQKSREDDIDEQDESNQEDGDESQFDRYDKSGNYKPDPKFSAESKFKPAMDSSMFRKSGHEIIDWAVQYMKTLKKRNPTSDVKPGWLSKVVPKDPPQQGESFEKILKDLEEVVCKGVR